MFLGSGGKTEEARKTFHIIFFPFHCFAAVREPLRCFCGRVPGTEHQRQKNGTGQMTEYRIPKKRIPRFFKSFFRKPGQIVPGGGMRGKMNPLHTVIQRKFMSAGKEGKHLDNLLGMDIAVENPHFRTAFRTSEKMVVARMDQLKGSLRKKGPGPVQNVFQCAGNNQKKFMELMTVFREKLSFPVAGLL